MTPRRPAPPLCVAVILLAPGHAQRGTRGPWPPWPPVPHTITVLSAPLFVSRSFRDALRPSSRKQRRRGCWVFLTAAPVNHFPFAQRPRASSSAAICGSAACPGWGGWKHEQHPLPVRLHAPTSPTSEGSPPFTRSLTRRTLSSDCSRKNQNDRTQKMRRTEFLILNALKEQTELSRAPPVEENAFIRGRPEKTKNTFHLCGLVLV